MPRLFARVPTLTLTLRSAAAPIVFNTFVGFDDQTASADAPVQGVADANTAQGDACPLISLGYVEMKAATAIAKGAKIFSDAAGLPTAAGATNHVGRALKAAANPGDTVGFVFNPR